MQVEESPSPTLLSKTVRTGLRKTNTEGMHGLNNAKEGRGGHGVPGVSQLRRPRTGSALGAFVLSKMVAPPAFGSQLRIHWGQGLLYFVLYSCPDLTPQHLSWGPHAPPPPPHHVQEEVTCSWAQGPHAACALGAGEHTLLRGYAVTRSGDAEPLGAFARLWRWGGRGKTEHPPEGAHSPDRPLRERGVGNGWKGGASQVCSAAR